MSRPPSPSLHRLRTLPALLGLALGACALSAQAQAQTEGRRQRACHADRAARHHAGADRRAGGSRACCHALVPTSCSSGRVTPLAAAPTPARRPWASRRAMWCGCPTCPRRPARRSRKRSAMTCWPPPATRAGPTGRRLPEWVRGIAFEGDLRLRGQIDQLDDGNVAPEESSAPRPTRRPGPRTLTNTRADRNRLTLRARLGMNVKASDALSAGLRPEHRRQRRQPHLGLADPGHRLQPLQPVDGPRLAALGAAPGHEAGRRPHGRALRPQRPAVPG